MPLFRVTVVLSALLVTVAGPAAAQDPEIGSRVKKRVDTQLRSAEEARVGASRFARCVVQKRTGSARRLLEVTTEPEFATYSGVLNREVTCSSMVGSTIQQIGQSISTSRDVYRGNIAEALMNMTGKQPVPPALPLERQYSSAWADVSGRNIVVEEMAICLAATQPAYVAAVLATEHASTEEVAAIRAMVPMFGQCLSATAKLTANRQSMRAAMAEAYYHRIVAAPAAQVAEKK